MPETLEEIRAEITEVVGKADKRVDEVKKQFEDRLKTSDEAVADLTATITNMSNDVKDLESKLAATAKARTAEDEHLIRADMDGVLGTLTPGQLMFGASMVGASNDQQIAFRSRIMSAQAKITEAAAADRDALDGHFDAILRNSTVAHLPKNAPRRAHLEKTVNKFKADFQNALNSGDAGTPQMPAAELFDSVQATAQLYFRIPMEPRLAETGRVISASAFPAGRTEFVEDETAAAVNDDISENTAISLNAKTGIIASPLIADSYFEDYAFGSAVDDVMMPTIEAIGPDLDAAIAYGDVATSANFNGSSTGPADSLARAFAGFGGIANSNGTKVDAGGNALTIADIADAIGGLGQRFGGRPMDVVFVSNLRNIMDMVASANVLPSSIVSPSGDVSVGRVVNIAGVDLIVSDLTNTNTGRLASNGRRAASGTTASVGIALNVRVMKGGFARPITVTRKELTDRLASRLICHYRWAQNVSESAQGAVLVRNIIAG